MMHGSTSSAEFDEMDPVETRALGRRIVRARNIEREFLVTLAKFVAGARIQQRAEEVR